MFVPTKKNHVLFNQPSRSMVLPGLLLVGVIVLSGACMKENYAPETDEKLNLPQTAQLSQEEYEQYLMATQPGMEKELDGIETDLKKDLGVVDRKPPPPPPGWNLESALASAQKRPKIYRWIDGEGKIQITRFKPEKGTRILGWRYEEQPTPTATPFSDDKKGKGQDKSDIPGVTNFDQPEEMAIPEYSVGDQGP